MMNVSDAPGEPLGSLLDPPPCDKDDDTRDTEVQLHPHRGAQDTLGETDHDAGNAERLQGLGENLHRAPFSSDQAAFRRAARFLSRMQTPARPAKKRGTEIN